MFVTKYVRNKNKKWKSVAVLLYHSIVIFADCRSNYSGKNIIVAKKTAFSEDKQNRNGDHITKVSEISGNLFFKATQWFFSKIYSTFGNPVNEIASSNNCPQLRIFIIALQYWNCHIFQHIISKKYDFRSPNQVIVMSKIYFAVFLSISIICRILDNNCLTILSRTQTRSRSNKTFF